MARGITALLAAIAGSAVAGTPELDNAVGSHLRNGTGDESVPGYRWSKANLNGDDEPDAVVLLIDAEFCGSGGCTMLAFEGKAGGYEFASLVTVTREPVYLLRETRYGWHTLSVLVAGGGLDAHQALLRFDGEKYPKNPTLQDHAGPQDLEGAEKLILE